MAYLHINNLYKDQRIREFKKVFCLEKIHGTSAHISWNDQRLGFFSGGEKYERFVNLFDQEELSQKFTEFLGEAKAIVYGEAYGGRQQGMKETYGVDLRFIVFDIKVGDNWLAVPQASELTNKLGLDFVSWVETDSTLEALNEQRDLPSSQAAEEGLHRKREGIVIRPPFEVTLNNGERLIAKHKNDDFKETKTPRIVSDEELRVLADAEAIADEWVTPMRLTHVLDKLPEATGIEHTGLVIRAMVDDVLREAKGEIVASKVAKKAISARASKLWKIKVTKL